MEQGWSTVGKLKPQQNGKKKSPIVQQKKEIKKKAIKPLHKYEEFKLEEEPKTEEIVKPLVEKKSKPVQKVAKKQTAPQHTKSRTLQEAIKKLNLTELKNTVDAMEKNFPTMPVVWLRDVVQALNLRLCPTTPADSAYRGETVPDAPLGYFSAPVTELFLNTLASLPESVIRSFYRSSCLSLVEDAGKGWPVHGFATFVMLLQRHHAATCLPERHHLHVSCSHNTRALLTHVWVVEGAVQSAVLAGDVSAAVDLWQSSLVPHLDHALTVQMVVDATARLVTAVVSSLECGSGSGAKGSVCIDRGDLEAASRLLKSLLSLALPVSTSVPRTLTRQLVKLIPQLKRVFQHDAAEAFSCVALPGLDRSHSSAYRQECADLCATWLRQPVVWKAWLEVLPSHTPQSLMLLKSLDLSRYGPASTRKLANTVSALGEDNPSAKEMKFVMKNSLSKLPANYSRSYTLPSILFCLLSLYVMLSLTLITVEKYDVFTLPPQLKTITQFNAEYLSITWQDLGSAWQCLAEKFPAAKNVITHYWKVLCSLEVVQTLATALENCRQLINDWLDDLTGSGDSR